jgi:hypothetical protein
MKRGLFISLIPVLFITLSFLPSLYALTFEVNPEYNLGETMIMRVAGNFTSTLEKSNVFFYQGHSRMPMQYNVIQAGNEYYIYVLLAGKSEGNYSVSLENIMYLEGTSLMDESVSRNFSITNRTADFYISPGAVSASGNFSFEVQNLKNSAISISVTTSEGKANERQIFISPQNSTSASFSIPAGQKKRIDFQPGIGNKTLRFIEVKTSNITEATSYKIPAYVWGIISPRVQTTFFIEPSSISYSFYTNSQERKEIYLYNIGNSELKNVVLSADSEFSNYLNLSKTKFNLPANSKVAIGMIFFSETEKDILGNIEAKTGNITAYSSLSINFVSLPSITVVNETKNNTANLENTTNTTINNATNISSNISNVTSNITSNNTSNVTSNTTVNVTSNKTSDNLPVIINKTQIQSVLRTCSELKGLVCTSSQVCSQEPVYAKDNVCCLAQCQEIKKDNSGTFIAIGIVILIIIIVLWFVVKMKKTKQSSVNLLKVARGKN